MNQVELDLIKETCSLRAELDEFKSQYEAVVAELEEVSGKWNSSDVTPDNLMPVRVNIVRTYQYKHYRASSQQAKKGLKGRWQKFNGYGWDNCDAPSQWQYINVNSI